MLTRMTENDTKPTNSTTPKKRVNQMQISGVDKKFEEVIRTLFADDATDLRQAFYVLFGCLLDPECPKAVEMFLIHEGRNLERIIKADEGVPDYAGLAKKLRDALGGKLEH